MRRELLRHLLRERRLEPPVLVDLRELAQLRGRLLAQLSPLLREIRRLSRIASFVDPAAATPTISAAVETIPSLAPSTAARSQPTLPVL
jgi:hypothetical protein